LSQGADTLFMATHKHSPLARQQLLRAAHGLLPQQDDLPLRPPASDLRLNIVEARGGLWTGLHPAVPAKLKAPASHLIRQEHLDPSPLNIVHGDLALPRPRRL
jgi:hypothetical protein